jgi:hypothetical protein
MRSVKARVNDAGPIDHQCNMELYVENEAMFHGYLLYHCNSVSKKAVKQMFFLTFAAKFHGLSKTGIKMLAKYGFISKITSFRTGMDKAEDRASEHVIKYVTLLCMHYTASSYFTLID